MERPEKLSIRKRDEARATKDMQEIIDEKMYEVVMIAADGEQSVRRMVGKAVKLHLQFESRLHTIKTLGITEV